MKFLMLLVLIAFLVSDAPAVTVTALDISILDCTPQPGEHGHVYVNYADEKYQQAVNLSVDTTREGCALLRSGAWHHDGGGQAVVVSGLLEWDGDYKQVGGLPAVLYVVYLPLIRK